MANAWTTFEQLLSKDKRFIGKVISTNATTKRVNITQVGNNIEISVESNGSSYENGSHVFVQGGIITGSAPNIREVVIELLS